jgi:hypothetical protein
MDDGGRPVAVAYTAKDVPPASTAARELRRTDDDSAPFNSEQFEAGYLTRLSGVPQCLSATRGWRAGWEDADAGFCRSAAPKAS